MQPPDTLSPSKMERYTTCPLSFRYAYIDKIPEPTTLSQFKGTFTHKILELLYQDKPFLRTKEQSMHILNSLWEAEKDSENVNEVVENLTDKDDLISDIRKLVLSYFDMEDPVSVDCKATELDITTEISGHKIRGIIDRLDVAEGDQLSIIDYKTGQAPSESFEKSKLNAVLVYALLCEAEFGQLPMEVKLIYLKSRISITKIPSEQSMRAVRARILAIANAIERACEYDDFRPKPSRLCSYCSYQSICPLFSKPQVEGN